MKQRKYISLAIMTFLIVLGTGLFLESGASASTSLAKTSADYAADIAAAEAALSSKGIKLQEAVSGLAISKPEGQANKRLVDQYRSLLNAYKNAAQREKAAKAAAALSSSGAQEKSNVPYGTKAVASADGMRINILDNAGNKLTTMGISTDAEGIKAALARWDLDPASLQKARKGYRESNPSVDKALNSAVATYVRNPMIAYGEMFLNPTSKYKNKDGSYQVPGTGNYKQNAKSITSKELTEKFGYSSQESFEVLEQVRMLPIDIESIMQTSDPLSAMRAAKAAFRNDPEWQKVNTAWQNHNAINRGANKNNSVDTSGIVFDFAGNASNGKISGSGFSGSGYEAGYYPGDNVDDANYPGVVKNESGEWVSRSGRTAQNAAFAKLDKAGLLAKKKAEVDAFCAGAPAADCEKVREVMASLESKVDEMISDGRVSGRERLIFRSGLNELKMALAEVKAMPSRVVSSDLAKAKDSARSTEASSIQRNHLNSLKNKAANFKVQSAR